MKTHKNFYRAEALFFVKISNAVNFTIETDDITSLISPLWDLNFSGLVSYSWEYSVEKKELLIEINLRFYNVSGIQDDEDNNANLFLRKLSHKISSYISSVLKGVEIENYWTDRASENIQGLRYSGELVFSLNRHQWSLPLPCKN